MAEPTQQVEASQPQEASDVTAIQKGNTTKIYPSVKILGETVTIPDELHLEGNRKPLLPNRWSYDNAIKDIKFAMLSWNAMTQPIMKHLWIAKKILKKNRMKDKYGIPRTKTWGEFCESLGTSSQVINRWLSQWFEKPTVIEPDVGKPNLIHEYEDNESEKHLYIYRKKRTYPNGDVKYSHYVRYSNEEDNNKSKPKKPKKAKDKIDDNTPTISREEAEKCLGHGD